MKADIVLKKELLKGNDGGYYVPNVDNDYNLAFIPSNEKMPEVEATNLKEITLEGITESKQYKDMYAAEASRQQAETQRSAAETARAATEAQRNQAEVKRVGAEANREAAEIARQETAQRAENAAIGAETATQAANDAIETLVNNAHAAAIVPTAEGKVITINDASNEPFQGMKIYGKTTQDGTPSPDAPIDLINIGNNGTIGVVIEDGENGAQSIIIPTPDGLPGIPVGSGGNYTDENGQQWICDEIDLARGVYIKRVDKDVLDGSTRMTWQENRTTENTMLFNFENVFGNYIGLEKRFCITDKFPSFFGWNPQSWGYGYGDVENIGFNPDANYCRFLYLRIKRERLATQDVKGVMEWLADNPINIIYQLIEPIETPLDAETIATYHALHTYKPNTTIYNDAAVHMGVNYAADTKTYIDNKLEALTNAIVSMGGNV